MEFNNQHHSYSQETVQPQQTDTHIDSFMEEVATPTTPAIGTDAFGAAPDGPAWTPPPPPPGPVYEPPAGAEPVFKDVVNDDTIKDDPQVTTQPVFSMDYKKKTLRMLLNMEEKACAWAFCQWTKTSDQSKFMYSPGTKEMLIDALEPYMDMIVETIPAFIPLLLIYTGAKVDHFAVAMAIRSKNKQNEAAKKNVDKMQAVANTAAAQKDEERTNFALYADGYYRNDRSGGYIGDRAGEGKALLEKPSMDDLEKILKVKANRNAELLCKVFDITEADFERLGINLGKRIPLA